LEPKPENWAPRFEGDIWEGRKKGTYSWFEIQDSSEYYPVFEAPKIIYQAIQYHPRYCIDESRLFTSNKTFVIGGADRSLVAVLNSPLLWWFSWRHFVHMKDEALSNDGFKMKSLPIQTAALADTRIIEVTEQLEATTKMVAEHATAILDWLSSEFAIANPTGGLSTPDLLDMEAFLQATKSNLEKGRKLTAADISELRREYGATIEPARQLRANILRLEQRLSDLVNEAYGLTAEEVQLMWRTAPPRMPFTPAGLSSEADTDSNEKGADEGAVA
jgi:hypothetical protein